MLSALFKIIEPWYLKRIIIIAQYCLQKVDDLEYGQKIVLKLRNPEVQFPAQKQRQSLIRSD